MQSTINNELYDIMDALAAIRMTLSCETQIVGETLVLSSAQARGACKALEKAAASIDRIRAAPAGTDGSGAER
jgi:hypothetical protein